MPKHGCLIVYNEGMREMAAEALAKLCKCVEDQDPTLLILLLEVMEVILFLGDSPPPDEFVDFPNPDDDKEVLDSFFCEPAAVDALVNVGVFLFLSSSIRSNKLW